jgi:hypothetical protein
MPTEDSQSQSRTNRTRRRHRARNEATGKKREHIFGPVEKHPTNRNLRIWPILNAGREGRCERCKRKDQGCQHLFLFENGSDERIRSCRDCLGIDEGRLCGGPAGLTADESARRRLKDQARAQQRRAKLQAERDMQSQAVQAAMEEAGERHRGNATFARE